MEKLRTRNRYILKKDKKKNSLSYEICSNCSTFLMISIDFRNNLILNFNIVFYIKLLSSCEF